MHGCAKEYGSHGPHQDQSIEAKTFSGRKERIYREQTLRGPTVQPFPGTGGSATRGIPPVETLGKGILFQHGGRRSSAFPTMHHTHRPGPQGCSSSKKKYKVQGRDTLVTKHRLTSTHSTSPTYHTHCHPKKSYASPRIFLHVISPCECLAYIVGVCTLGLDLG